ncbi:MAG: hypothetical protein AB1753_03020 [Thermoproteota archaeon]
MRTEPKKREPGEPGSETREMTPDEHEQVARRNDQTSPNPKIQERKGTVATAASSSEAPSSSSSTDPTS